MNLAYRIFFRRLRSSRREAWRLLETICLYFPVSTSFCLLRNHWGMVYCRGLEMTAMSLSISSLDSSPALINKRKSIQSIYRLVTSTSAFLHTAVAKRRPIPLMEVRAYTIFFFPSMLVLSTRRMCWNSPWLTRAYETHKTTSLHRIQSNLPY